MEIRIEPQTPDGVIICIEDIVVDNLDEAHRLIKLVTEVWGTRKLDPNECQKLYNELTEKNVSD